MSLGRDLLEQARFLAKREPRKPKQASLRRAVSSAYYALFHYLGEECSGVILGVTADKRELRNLSRRALVHGKMNSLCSQFSGGGQVSPLLLGFWSPLNVGATRIVALATHFRSLQEERHRADYDVSTTFTRADALSACDLADEAMTAWEDVRANHPRVAELFSTALYLWPSLSQR